MFETKTEVYEVGPGTGMKTKTEDGFYIATQKRAESQTVSIQSVDPSTPSDKLEYYTNTKADKTVVDSPTFPTSITLEPQEELYVSMTYNEEVPGETEEGLTTTISKHRDVVYTLKVEYDEEIPIVYDPSKTVLTQNDTEFDLYGHDTLEVSVEFKNNDGSNHVLKTPPYMYSGSDIVAAGTITQTGYDFEYKLTEVGSTSYIIKSEEINYMSEEIKTTTKDSTPKFDPALTVIIASPNPLDVFVESEAIMEITTKFDDGSPYTPGHIDLKLYPEDVDNVEYSMDVSENGTTQFTVSPTKVGTYSIGVEVDGVVLSQVTTLEVTTSEVVKPPITKPRHTGFNPLPHRNSVYMTMGYWVIDEILEKEAKGEAWYEDQSTCKYPKDVELIAYLLDTYKNVEIQESRNGRILGREAFEFNR